MLQVKSRELVLCRISKVVSHCETFCSLSDAQLNILCKALSKAKGRVTPDRQAVSKQ